MHYLQLQGRDGFWGAKFYSSFVNIFLASELIVHESQELVNSIGGSIAAKLGGYHIVGSIYLFGPRTAVLRRRLNVLKGRQLFHQKEQELLLQSSYPRQRPTLVAVSSIAQSENCIVRIFCDSSDHFYELLREILRPLSVELPGLHPYADRCLDPLEGERNSYRDSNSNGSGNIEERLHPSDPLILLREHDKIST